MLDKAMKRAHSVDAAIPNSHNLQSTITERLQKCTALKEELIRIGFTLSQATKALK